MTAVLIRLKMYISTAVWNCFVKKKINNSKVLPALPNLYWEGISLIREARLVRSFQETEMWWMSVEFGWLILLHVYWNFLWKIYLPERDKTTPKTVAMTITDWTYPLIKERTGKVRGLSRQIEKFSSMELLLPSAISLLWRSKCSHRKSQQHFKNNCSSSWVLTKTYPPANTPYVSSYPSNENSFEWNQIIIKKKKYPSCSKHVLR